ncbi:hypothetical protein LXL04_035927 [Taraxacum kok-saghyz]
MTHLHLHRYISSPPSSATATTGDPNNSRRRFLPDLASAAFWSWISASWICRWWFCCFAAVLLFLRLWWFCYCPHSGVVWFWRSFGDPLVEREVAAVLLHHCVYVLWVGGSPVAVAFYLNLSLFQESADVKKQTVFCLQTADVWSTSSAAEGCRCGPQTADVLTSKKQTAPKFIETKGLFVFWPEALLTTYVCAAQTTPIHRPLAAIQGLEKRSDRFFLPFSIDRSLSPFQHHDRSSASCSSYARRSSPVLDLLCRKPQQARATVAVAPGFLRSPPSEPTTAIASRYVLFSLSTSIEPTAAPFSLSPSIEPTAAPCFRPSFGSYKTVELKFSCGQIHKNKDEVQTHGTAVDREFMTQLRDEIAEQLMQIYLYFSLFQQSADVKKQSSSCRLQTFGPPLLLQRLADVVRRLQMFWLRKNKQHLNVNRYAQGFG